jgi:hypothetical protein
MIHCLPTSNSRPLPNDAAPLCGFPQVSILCLFLVQVNLFVVVRLCTQTHLCTSAKTPLFVCCVSQFKQFHFDVLTCCDAPEVWCFLSFSRFGMCLALQDSQVCADRLPQYINDLPFVCDVSAHVQTRI